MNTGDIQVKVLAIGDPHFRVSTVKDNDMFIQKVLDVIEKFKPDIVVCLGDLLHDHEKLHTIALNQAHKFIKVVSLQVPIYVLVGNHDMINASQFLTTNHWMNGMKEWHNVFIADRVLDLKLKDREFYFLPYVPPGRFIEALETSEQDWKQATCIFAHQEFKGCKMGAMLSEIGDEYDVKLPLVVSGHIHDRQIPQLNIIYTGSSMQHAFGESGHKSISLLTFTGKTEYKETELFLDLPRRMIKYIDTSELNKLNIELYTSSPDYIKLSVSGTHEEFKTFKKSEKYKELTRKGVKVVFKVFKKELDSVEKKEHRGFEEILKELIQKENNPSLLKVYNRIFEKIIPDNTQDVLEV